MFIIIIITFLKLILDCGTAAPRGRQTLGRTAGRLPELRDCGDSDCGPPGTSALDLIFKYNNKY